MKGIILAAGRGRRLGKLTDERPKPLVDFRGKPMIDYALESMHVAGIKECVINLFYKGEKIADYVGNGERWGLNVSYSRETDVLNTGGGVRHALPLLGAESFLLMTCDLFHDVDLARLINRPLSPQILAHLVLVDVPNDVASHAPDAKGDFSLQGDQVVAGDDFNFAGIGIINPQLLDQQNSCRIFPLSDALDVAVGQNLVTGELHQGLWLDLGTPDNLKK